MVIDVGKGHPHENRCIISSDPVRDTYCVYASPSSSLPLQSARVFLRSRCCRSPTFPDFIVPSRLVCMIRGGTHGRASGRHAMSGLEKYPRSTHRHAARTRNSVSGRGGADDRKNRTNSKTDGGTRTNRKYIDDQSQKFTALKSFNIFSASSMFLHTIARNSGLKKKKIRRALIEQDQPLRRKNSHTVNIVERIPHRTQPMHAGFSADKLRNPSLPSPFSPSPSPSSTHYKI